MLDELKPIAQACDLTVEDHVRRRVAIVGAGAIVDVAHLVAYRKVGLEVVGLFDQDPARAAEVAARHGVETTYGSLDDLLNDERVEVIDIAVHPSAQPGIVRSVISAGKHALCQKPFAPDVTTALELAELAEHAGLQIAVNQQLRYDEGIAAARAMVRAGWIGEVLECTFDVDIDTDFSAWTWMSGSTRLEITYHSIHYLDAIRGFLGEPDRVFSTAGSLPGAALIGETATTTSMRFAGGVRALVHANHHNIYGRPNASFLLTGTAGRIHGTLGLLYDYPLGRPDTLEVHSRALPTDGWLSYPVTRRWLPDAFVVPMRALLHAINSGVPAETNGRDNASTIALVDACYRSIETGEAQRPVVVSVA